MSEETIIEQEQEESLFKLKDIIPIVFTNWKWFVLSFVVCVSLSFVYLHYTPKTYSAMTKVLIKEEEHTGRSSKSALQNIENLGMITNSAGIDNEVEILNSPTVMEDVARKLNLNIEYSVKRLIGKRLLYKNQPVTAVLKQTVDDEDFSPINVALKYEDNTYEAKISYYEYDKNAQKFNPVDTLYEFKKLPFTFNTGQGSVTLMSNALPHKKMKPSTVYLIDIYSFTSAALGFANAINVEPTSKMTTIAAIDIIDYHPRRATDILNQLVQSYNDIANDDKNEVAQRTEDFINSRLEKIDVELGVTESRLESYKKSNSLFDVRQKTQSALAQQNIYAQKIGDASTQIDLLSSLQAYINNPENRYEAMPSNIGLQDQATLNIIQKYNEAVLARKRLLISSSETSPAVVATTTEVNELLSNLRQSVLHALESARTIYRNESHQLSKYSNELSLSPSQERVLNQIGRQQEVRSNIYLLLLQKREENSISLAATANKGKMIVRPCPGGVVGPKRNMIMGLGALAGLALPYLIIILLQFVRYKIDGRDDVKKLTSLPIVAEIAVFDAMKKGRGDIAVHENSNEVPDEMFRLLRTNLLFTMKENENVILFTSNIPGEGKTFVACNLAVSFALYGKRVIVVGLDIRKPRLADLFEINNHHTGISLLLQKNAPTAEEIRTQIIPSGVHGNLDLLMAGPIPPNPSELIGRESLAIIIEELKKEYDYVILDTAPVGLVTDTLQIGRHANATVFVCRANYTPKARFQYLNELAKEKKLPNVSLVINGIDLKSKLYSRFGKYGSYRYGAYNSYATLEKY